MLNYLQSSSPRPGAAQHRHVLQLQGKCLRPPQTVLEVTPEPSSSDLRGAEEAQHTAGKGCQALNYTGLNMRRFFESMLDESFGLHGLKKKESIFCLLLHSAPHFKAIFKDIIPQADMHMRWSQRG